MVCAEPSVRHSADSASEHIWWHEPTWWWIMPRDYWVFFAVGCGAYLAGVWLK